MTSREKRIINKTKKELSKGIGRTVEIVIGRFGRGLLESRIDYESKCIIEKYAITENELQLKGMLMEADFPNQIKYYCLSNYLKIVPFLGEYYMSGLTNIAFIREIKTSKGGILYENRNPLDFFELEKNYEKTRKEFLLK